MIRRGLLVAGLTAALGLAAGFAPLPWTIDRDASRIEMSVRAFGSERTGRFNDWRGDIVFDPSAPARTRATVVVETASLSMSPAIALRRAVGPAFLDADRYPVIRFDLRSLEPIDGERYTAHADVTLKGRTRPVTFPVVLRVTDDRAHLAGALIIDRADFGIGTSGPWNRLVARQVTVRVSLQARRG